MTVYLETKKMAYNKRKSEVTLQLCRTCLLEKNEEDMEEIYDIGNILKDIVPIEFVKKDGWPNNICSDCSIQANQAYQFRRMCIETDGILTKRVAQKLNNKDISNNDDDDTNSSKSEAKVSVKEEAEESSGVCIKNNEDVLFEFCEIKREQEYEIEEKEKETDICEKEEEFEVCEKEEEYGMYEKEKKIADNNDTNDEHEDFSAEENQNETTTRRKQLCCTFCDKEFNDESDLMEHREKHLTERICHYCNMYLSSVQSYRQHMRRHKRQGLYPCKTCGKSFQLPDYLRIHEQTHSTARPYKCTKCDKTFAIPSRLKKHLNGFAHTKAKPYVCNICDKGFARNVTLNYHIKHQHIRPTDQRPYVCACGKSFKGKQLLTQHQNSVHTTVKKYKCDLCEMSFKCKRNLVGHKKVHEGIKPFVCDICGYAFFYQSVLNTHMRVHSKKEMNQINKILESRAGMEPNKS